jgi:DNA-binding MarR family transcriptional regulator
MINGESFLVEANRVHKLESRENPGVGYQVAVRLAPIQHLKLNTIEFDYDVFFRVEDDRGREKRSARLSHQLGFSMLITDLGAPLKPEQLNEALKLLTESVTKTFQALEVKDLTTTEPHARQFGAAQARGLVVRYRDADDFSHACLVYVLATGQTAATCVVQYMEDDADNALPLIKRTLDSLQAME